MPAFNESQKAAIKARNQNILVSAAAGSGKTTVMVEKIKETLIAHPEASISQFLVITFTKEIAIIIRKNTTGKPPRLDRYLRASVDWNAAMNITHIAPMVTPHTILSHVGDSASSAESPLVHRPDIALVLESDAVTKEMNTTIRNTAIAMDAIGICWNTAYVAYSVPPFVIASLMPLPCIS